MTARFVLGWILGLAVLGLAGCKGGGSGCPPGTLNCPCDDQGQCSGGLQCREGFCVPGDCPEGTSGCPCRAGGTCDPGLTCSNNVCQLLGGPGLSVGNPAVRACDVLIEAGTSGAATAAFDNTVIGEYVREGSRMAVSFTARGDAALGGTLALLLDGDGQVVQPSGVALSQVECFDQLGSAVADPDVKFE